MYYIIDSQIFDTKTLKQEGRKEGGKGGKGGKEEYVTFIFSSDEIFSSFCLNKNSLFIYIGLICKIFSLNFENSTKVTVLFISLPDECQEMAMTGYFGTCLICLSLYHIYYNLF